jgi:protein-S-isoprenylcysteine O-methyltransferase Ste14
MTVPADHAHVIAPPPLIAGAAMLFGAGLHCLWPVPVWPWPRAWVVAGACFAASLILAGWAVRRIWRVRSSVLPHRTTTALVTTGPFRITRNPLYLAMGLLLTGVAFAVNSLAMLLAIVPWTVVMRHGVIAREERYLEGKFGEDYRAYCRRVRRWL